MTDYLVREESDDIGRKYARSVFEHVHAVLFIRLSEDDLARIFGRIIHETGEDLMRDVMAALKDGR